MLGSMQDWPLTVDKLFDHARRWHGDQQIVTQSVEGGITRSTYAEAHDRARRLSNALLALGIAPGDRVATLAWNTVRHVEAWYATVGIGAVCHTLNPRLFPDQLAWIIDHAADRVLLADLSFVPLVAALRDRMPSVEHVVVMTDRDHMPAELPGALCYEDLVEQHHADVRWGGFDEQTAAGLCYTSGTTGAPKGVLYSHRSQFIHALCTMTTDVMQISAADTLLPIVPMFHANAWGVVFSAPASGARLVLPGAKLDGPSIHALLETEGVTFAAAVPTVWQTLLQHLRDTGGRLTTLKRTVIGGAAVPESVVRAFEDDYGVQVRHAWGMTELSPLGTVASPTTATLGLDIDAQRRLELKQGRPPIGVELKIVDAAGAPLPHDGEAAGRLMARGPFVVGRYYRDDSDILDPGSYFDTGDIATIDRFGFMQIVDRAKDVIKSGGEWISSVEIENIAAGHPAAALAAVIGAPHPKWGERPLLLVRLKDGAATTAEEILAWLDGRIPRWWMPDAVEFVDDIPLGATGKIDKKLLRQRFADYRLA